MGDRCNITEDELIATLRNSALKTILVEGGDDIFIYRKMQENIRLSDFDIHPCDGREMLLKLYKRRSEIKGKVLFICDMDLWCFTGRPEFLDESVITTVGYSIENDFYIDGESYLNSLLSPSERERFDLLIQEVVKWYSFEIEKHLKGRTEDCSFSKVKLLNKSVIPKDQNVFSEEFLREKGVTSADEELSVRIYSEFRTLLRGKFIFQIFQKIIMESERKSSTYSSIQMFEMIFAHVKASGHTESILSTRIKEIEDFFTN